MSRHVHRFFAAGLADGVAELSSGDRHHLERVLRMRVGDTCEVVVGGRVHRARLTGRGLEPYEEVEP